MEGHTHNMIEHLPNFVGEVNLEPLASPPFSNSILPHQLHSL